MTGTRQRLSRRATYAAAIVTVALVAGACSSAAATAAPSAAASAAAAPSSAASAAPASAAPASPGTTPASSAAALSCNTTQSTPGVTSTTVTLGVTAPLTGSAASTGIPEVQGLKAYFDYVNAHGGVHGHQIKLIALDDQYKPATTESQTRLLVQQDHIFAWVGGQGTPTFLAAEPVLKAANVPAIAPGAESSTLGTMSTPNVYSTFVNYITMYQIETKYIIQHYHPKSYALVGVAGNVDQDALKGMQLAVGPGVSIKNIPETPGNPNLTPIAQTLKSGNYDWVFIILTGADSGNLLEAMQRIGYTPHVAGNQINADATFIQPYKSVDNNMIVTVLAADLTSTAPAVTQFINEFKAQTGKAPTSTDEQAWGQAEIAVQAMKTAPALTTSCLYAALNAMHDYKTGIMPPVTFGPNIRQGVGAIEIEQIQNGKLVPLTSGFVGLNGAQ